MEEKHHRGLKDILERNTDAKEDMRKKFRSQTKLKNHFPDECFQVFTVSTKEFLQRQYLDSEETEIPKLQEVLQRLNDCHSETLNYARGAEGILSLIQGVRTAEVNEEGVCNELQGNLASGQETLLKAMESTKAAFDNFLCSGVENSLKSCGPVLADFLNNKDARGFHKTLKCIVSKSGDHTTMKGEILNLNETLASWLEESIDEEFNKTFPNCQNCEPFNGHIKSFSLKTGKLIEDYKDRAGMELRLQYLETEEDKMKARLQKTILKRKKSIYNSLETSIKENMKTCYDEAKQCEGRGSLEQMKTIIQDHVDAQKNVIFEEAKDKMMSELQKLMDDIMKTLEEDMKKAIEHSLKTNFESLPDVSQELDTVTKYYFQLKEKQRTAHMRSPEGAGPSKA